MKSKEKGENFVKDTSSEDICIIAKKLGKNGEGGFTLHASLLTEKSQKKKKKWSRMFYLTCVSEEQNTGRLHIVHTDFVFSDTNFVSKRSDKKLETSIQVL